MNTKHTPGPWISTPSGITMSEAYSQPFAIAQYGEANLIAGAFGDVRGGIEVAEANALLIAAAPELLEALIALLPSAEDHRDEGPEGSGWQSADLLINIAKAKDAIAKATQG